MTRSKESGVEVEQADGCVEDLELDESEATLDVELPPSRGGVERPVPAAPERGA